MIVDFATGEYTELAASDEDSARRSYSFGGRYGQFSFERVLAMLSADSGLTGDAIRVFWYCAIMTYKQGGATAKEAADHCGLTVQATRRIAKELAENKLFLVAEVIGRTKRYKASPHIISSLSGADQSAEAAAYHLPTLPGRRIGTAPKDTTNASQQPVPRTRGAAGTDKRSVAPEAERLDDLRDPGRFGAQRRADGG
ncbi:MarR family transcriptional regulator (plasmid) [Streptomyces sp. NBC_00053]|uniref:MarR family transcriptional regulator n=1 Tax=unclassified Streptomyces TaxID=2593676 RepID=UPI002250D46E|nr:MULTISPECIES: MarR family transcriptional regulator [unclassified Streptomyces]MCX4400136.1 MarR family transcriptional regulator [Streptomyces sp. NBC_01767]MCX5103012.1 MarR family transcriptional regulator [Streptomyces sp. NBC_00439]MCX5106697.1 MarR family transcriptional regulator [Streptomyces sp. NBC_00439]MCX5505524.1 MarR family transcriptional regulator [Streptomyces sp. NBC_00052]MCX5545936.1 MarR family transcriptional regulator [Streptomyces sp. NBC_00051]